MDNLVQLSMFRTYWNISDKTGHLLSAHVIAIKDGKVIYDEVCEISISYHVGYEQYEIYISWNLNDAAVHSLGLHLSYNTNFQEFCFEGEILKIKAGNGMEVQITSILEE